MASKSTGWKCTHTAAITAQTDTAVSIKVTCYWQNLGWTYNINNVTAWVYCGGKSYKVKDAGSVNATSSTSGSYSMGSYTFTIDKTTATQNMTCYAKITSNSSYVSGTKTSSSTSISVSPKTSYAVTYNANGGSGAPGAQTKWYGTNLVLSSAVPVKTGHSFVRWNTNTSNSGTAYNPGATYSVNAALTLYAIWSPNTYTVTYNANGGSGAPSNQTKTYGVNLTLSSTIPTRTDYNFLGWSTSPDGAVVYAVGANYTNNSNITLYAIWELAYVKPRINNFDASRCDSTGASDDSGTYINVTFDWATDKAVSSIVIEWKTQLESVWTTYNVTASGTSGSINQVVGDGALSNEVSYIVRAYVSDSGGPTYSPQILIGTPTYPIDILDQALGIAFGKAAELLGIADFKYTVKLGGGLVPIFLEAETDLNDVKTPNFYTGENITQYNYTNCPLTLGTFYLEVVSMGENGQVRQTISSCSKYSSLTYERVYYEGTWGEWRNCFKGEEVLYEDANGSSAAITLSASAEEFKYLEIYYNDNLDRGCGYTKVPDPNGKTIHLCLTEASSSTITFYRRTSYTISGTSITPDITNAGYVKITAASPSHSGGTNFLKITKVVGHR